MLTNCGSIAIALSAEYGDVSDGASSFSGRICSTDWFAARSHAAMCRNIADLADTPAAGRAKRKQRHADAGAAGPANHRSRPTCPRSASTAGRKHPPLRKETDDEKGLAFEIEEIAWMHEHSSLFEQIDDDRVFGRQRRHLHDRIPSGFHRHHRARRHRGSGRDQRARNSRAHGSESARARTAPAASKSGAATCTGVDTDK